MKRIFAILMVALFMVSVMMVMTAPAFAAKFSPQAPQCEKDRGGDNPNCPGKRR
jgi:hypothetical protein